MSRPGEGIGPALRLAACAVRDFLRVSNRRRRESVERNHALTE
jgi:hypothetical protein